MTQTITSFGINEMLKRGDVITVNGAVTTSLKEGDIFTLAAKFKTPWKKVVDLPDKVTMVVRDVYWFERLWLVFRRECGRLWIHLQAQWSKP